MPSPSSLKPDFFSGFDEFFAFPRQAAAVLSHAEPRLLGSRGRRWQYAACRSLAKQDIPKAFFHLLHIWTTTLGIDDKKALSAAVLVGFLLIPYHT